MNVPFVDLGAQYEEIKEEVDAAIKNVVDTHMFIGGEDLNKFQEEFAKFCNAKFCVGVSSGTSALYVVLKALNIGAGDEVITAVHTFIATSESITNSGANVKFIGIDEGSYNMDPSKIEAAITDKTKAIIPVHLYGQPCDMKAIMEVAEKNDLRVIEDCAQAHASECYGKRIPYGDIGCFSFFPGKNLGAYGDAGGIVTKDEKFAEEAAMFINHGREKGEKYKHTREGDNFRMDNLQAAVLRVKLKYLEKWTESRRKNAARYNGLLKDTLKTPKEMDFAKHVYHLYVARCKKRDGLRDFLKENSISSGIHYPIPLHLQPAYKYLGIKEGMFPFEEKIVKEIISLPMYAELSEEQIKFVSEKIKEFYEK